MICPHCGYIQSDDALSCRRCMAVLEKPARGGAVRTFGENGNTVRSVAVKSSGAAYPLEVHSSENVPAWRAELSARVRQIKARRTMEAELEAALRDHREASVSPVIDLQPEDDLNFSVTAAEAVSVEAKCDEVIGEVRVEATFSHISASFRTRNEETNENPLVQAALNRVRRATESPRSAAPALKMRSVAPKSAGERGVLGAPGLNVSSKDVRIDMADIAQELELAIDSIDASQSTVSPLETRRAAVFPAAGGERLDWKLDESEILSSMPDERPYLQERLIAGMVDGITIALSSIPLWVVAAITETNLQNFQVQAMLLTSAALLAGMYLFATVATSGQTFGMMLAGLRVVSAHNGRSLTALQALMRAIGHIPSTLPLMGGFLWAAFDKNQRGLHEYISGTQLIRVQRVEAQQSR